MLRKIIIIILLIMGGIISLTLIYGFINGANTVLNPKQSNMNQIETKATEKSIQPDHVFNLVGLGDSLTKGVGDETGEGYFRKLAAKIEKNQKYKVSPINLAISGAKTQDLLNELGQTGVRNAITQADIIVLTIGANDLSPGAGRITKETITTLQPDVNAFISATNTLLTTLHEYNPNAKIYWISLYNPFEDLPEMGNTSEPILQWNAALEQSALNYSNVIIVPVFDLFQGKGKNYLFSDHYHPNGIGYQAIADRVYQTIESNFAGG